MEKLTIQEEEAMVLIWQHAPCVVRDILAFYEEPKPPYTTLASVFKNLERKGYIEPQKVGIVYEYRPLISIEEYKKEYLKYWVKAYCDGSYKDLLSFLFKEQCLSKKELKEIGKWLEKGGKKKKGDKKDKKKKKGDNPELPDSSDENHQEIYDESDE